MNKQFIRDVRKMNEYQKFLQNKAIDFMWAQE